MLETDIYVGILFIRKDQDISTAGTTEQYIISKGKSKWVVQTYKNIFPFTCADKHSNLLDFLVFSPFCKFSWPQPLLGLLPFFYNFQSDRITSLISNIS
jgi:hypothetical protein